MMPFENNSTTPGLDWIGEAFPEVLSTRLKSDSLYLIERDDRLNALDRLGIPATARPSRATVYQVAQELDADYVSDREFQVRWLHSHRPRAPDGRSSPPPWA